jgi:hypothetical protein
MRSRQHPSTTTLFTAGRDGLGGWGPMFGCDGHKPCSHPLRASASARTHLSGERFGQIDSFGVLNETIFVLRDGFVRDRRLNRHRLANAQSGFDPALFRSCACPFRGLIPSGFVGFRRCRYRRLEGIQLVQNVRCREVDSERRYEPDYRCETSDDEMRKMR